MGERERVVVTLSFSISFSLQTRVYVIAAFTGHVTHVGEEEEVAKQQSITQSLDFIIGGGADLFNFSLRRCVCVVDHGCFSVSLS